MNRRTITDGVVAAAGSILFIPGLLRLAPGLLAIGGYRAGSALKSALSR